MDKMRGPSKAKLRKTKRGHVEKDFSRESTKIAVSSSDTLRQGKLGEEYTAKKLEARVNDRTHKKGEGEISGREEGVSSLDLILILSKETRVQKGG